MAETITTKVELEKESEYRKAISNVNRALDSLNTKLAEVQRAFAETANSIDALRAKQEALTKIQVAQTERLNLSQVALSNAVKVQQTYATTVEQTRARVAAAAKTLDEAEQSNRAAGTAQEELTKQLEEYKKELSEAERCNEGAQQSVLSWQKQVEGAQTALAKTNQALDENSKYMDEAKVSSDGCAVSIDQYGEKLAQAQTSVEKNAAAIGAIGTALANAGVDKALKEIFEAVSECVDASAEFERAIADVQTALTGTPEQLADVSNGIKALETVVPASTEELAKVAQIAGQLGIATDDVLVFTEVVTKLAAVTNLSAEAAATALARFFSATGATADEYERLGSVITALGKEFAATESEIVALAGQLAYAGTLAGLSEADILALSAAMSSVGIASEAGGTAMTQTLIAMEKAVARGGTDLEKFAKIAGMSARTFAETWKTDAMTAVQAFIGGLGGLEAQGESATLVLDELGLSGVKQADMLERLSLAAGQVPGAVELASAAWEQNTALAEAAAQRYDTLESKMQLLENATGNLKIAIGDDLAPALSLLAEEGANASEWATKLVEENEWLVPVITGLITTVGVFVATVSGYTVAVNIAAAVTAAFSTAVASIPAVAIGAAVIGVVAAITTFAAAAKGAEENTKHLSTELQNAKEKYEELTAVAEEKTSSVENMVTALERLAGVETRTAGETAALKSLVDELNGAVPGLTLAYDEQTGALNMTTEAIRNLALAEAERQTQAAQAEYLGQLYVEQAQLADDLAAAQERLAQAQAQLAEAEADTSVQTEEQMWSLTAMRVAVTAAEKEIDKITAAQAAAAEETAKVEQEYEALAQTVTDVTPPYANMNDLIDEAKKNTEAHIEATKRNSSSTKSLMDETRKLNAAFAEQARNGDLSLGTTLDLIDAGYAAALSVDAETGAVRLDTEAYIALAGAKLDEQISVLTTEERNASARALKAEGAAATVAAHGFTDLIAVKEAEAAAARGEAISVGAMLAKLTELRENLGKVTEGTWSSSETSTRSSAPRQREQTQAERDLEAYQTAVAELDHQRAMDLLSEAAYYSEKAALGEQYLSENLEQRWRLDEELHAYQKGAYERELEELEAAYEHQEVSTEEYFSRLTALREEHLEMGTRAWQEAERAQREAEEKLREEAYNEEKADLAYFRDMEIVSEAEYYVELLRLQKEYLTEHTDEWQRVNVELKNYTDKQRQAALDEQKQALEAERKVYTAHMEERLSDMKRAYDAELAEMKSAYSEQGKLLKEGYDQAKNTAKATYDEKKKRIQAELSLEKERLNSIVSGIDAEIQARRNLREDESQDDAIAAAQKRLEAAQAQLGYARTEEDRAEWGKEVIRLQDALNAAIQAKEDTAFYREKEAEKSAVKEEIAAAEDAARAAQAAAEVAYQSQLVALEHMYNASVAQLEANYNAKLAAAEEAYNEQLRKFSEQYGAAWDRAEHQYRDAGRHSGGAGTALSTGVAEQMAAAAGVMSAAMAGAVTNVSSAVSNVKNANASVTLNSAPALTEGQIARVVKKVLDQLAQ